MEIKILRKRIKGMYIRVKDGAVVVTAPFHVSEYRIHEFVAAHSEWIDKQINKQNESILKDGQIVMILGKPFLVQEQGYFHIDSDRFIIGTDPSEYKLFIKRQIEPYLKKRFIYWSDRMGLSSVSVQFGFYKSKWGSCHKDKKIICLNYYLWFTDYDMIDAVIVHELCHMKYMNHSSLFYQEVFRWYPNYKHVHKKIKSVTIPTLS